MMIGDKFSLDKYIVKTTFRGRYLVFTEQGEKLFLGLRPFLRKQISIYDANNLKGRPLLKIGWKIQGSLIAYKFKYTVIDQGHSPIASIECEKLPVFSTNFTIKDIYNKEIALIQPDQIGCGFKCFNIVSGGRRIAVFYRNAFIAPSYLMDLSADKEKRLDRKIALSCAIILAAQNLKMQKFSGQVDWNQRVATGDEIYRIKRR